MMGCLNRPLAPEEPRTTSTVEEKLPQSKIKKIDLLLMLDNSASMGDKQAILAAAVPDLVRGLVNPQCIDDAGNAAPTQPLLPTDACPGKSFREFDAVTDIHIGLISSSLGSRGASTCQPKDGIANDDHGHLLARTASSKGHELADQDIATYQSHGFLAWDPLQILDPHGIGTIGDSTTPGIVPTLAEMVKGVGQDGCGYESQLESWYRFLVEPDPYDTITVNASSRSVVNGIDSELLAERKDFLRPDSLVAVILLTDENDCSLTDTGIGFIAANGGLLPRARQVCATNPDDECCKSCADTNLGKCAVDPTCTDPVTGKLAMLTAAEDPTNLRCFDQKRRFGIDFLYPLTRYTDGLTQAQVRNRAGQLVDNPLYPKADATKTDSTYRTPGGGLVFLAGIVGVPWEDIARKAKDGKPDLVHGLDATGKAVGGFMTAAELSARSPKDKVSTIWDQILGSKNTGGIPSDPLMRESRTPRMGTTPATGESLASIDAPGAKTNSVNGHEWDTLKSKQGDLEYACTFPLLTARPCDGEACDCDTAAKNPLCQDSNGAYQEKEQYFAKAYPGVRELTLLEQLGDQAIVASVCPAQLTDDSRAATDYGYRPATGAIIDKLKSRLSQKCLHRALNPDANSQVECLILEARSLDKGKTCDCAGGDLKARQSVSGTALEAEKLALEDPQAKAAGWNCFCEIKQLEGDALHACQFDASHSPKTASGADVDGWCYVDASSNPPAGNPALVSTCPASEQRKLRFVGAGEPLDDTTLFITCSGE